MNPFVIIPIGLPVVNYSVFRKASLHSRVDPSNNHLFTFDYHKNSENQTPPIALNKNKKRFSYHASFFSSTIVDMDNHVRQPMKLKITTPSRKIISGKMDPNVARSCM